MSGFMLYDLQSLCNVQVLPFITQRQVTGIDLLFRKEVPKNMSNKII